MESLTIFCVTEKNEKSALKKFLNMKLSNNGEQNDGRVLLHALLENVNEQYTNNENIKNHRILNNVLKNEYDK
jgi:hypothetical protein